MSKSFSSKGSLTEINILPPGWPTYWPWVEPNGGPPWPPGPLPPNGPWPIPPMPPPVIPKLYSLVVTLDKNTGPSLTVIEITAQVNDDLGAPTADLNNYLATVSAVDVNNAVHQIKKPGGNFADSIEFRIVGSTMVEDIFIGVGIDTTDIVFLVDIQPIVGGLSDTASFTVDDTVEVEFSVVLGSDTTGNAFYTADDTAAPSIAIYGNTSNELSSTKVWDTFSTSSAASQVIKLKIDGIETTYGTPDFTDIITATRHNVGKSSATGPFPNHYFVALGYKLVASGIFNSISIPVSGFDGNSFPSYTATIPGSIYKEQITDGTDLSTLTALQTFTLTVEASDEGGFVEGVLSPALDISFYL